MMEPAEDRERDDLTAGLRTRPRHRTTGDSLAQTLMGPCPIEVDIDVLPENSMELSLADYHDMVETLPPPDDLEQVSMPA